MTQEATSPTLRLRRLADQGGSPLARFVKRHGEDEVDEAIAALVAWQRYGPERKNAEERISRARDILKSVMDLDRAPRPLFRGMRVHRGDPIARRSVGDVFDVDFGGASGWSRDPEMAWSFATTSAWQGTFSDVQGADQAVLLELVDPGVEVLVAAPSHTAPWFEDEWTAKLDKKSRDDRSKEGETVIASSQLRVRIQRKDPYSEVMARRMKSAAIKTDPRSRFWFFEVPKEVTDLLADIGREAAEATGGTAEGSDHVTLCYVPKADAPLDDAEVDEALGIAQEVATGFHPFDVWIGGAAYFDGAEGPDGPATALVALIDGPGLSDLHVALKTALRDFGWEWDESHSFNAHLTLAYLPPGERWDDLPTIDAAWTLDTISFANAEIHDIPLGGGKKEASLVGPISPLERPRFVVEAVYTGFHGQVWSAEGYLDGVPHTYAFNVPVVQKWAEGNGIVYYIDIDKLEMDPSWSDPDDWDARTEMADLIYPILVVIVETGDLVVLDGVHRAFKAKALGKKKIRARVITWEDLLEIPGATVDPSELEEEPSQQEPVDPSSPAFSTAPPQDVLRGRQAHRRGTGMTRTAALPYPDISEEDWFQQMEARHAAEEDLVQKVLSGGERPLTIPGKAGGPIELLVHRDTYPGRVGKWRLTRFENGEPFGHTELSSWESAVREAKHWGADYTEARDASPATASLDGEAMLQFRTKPAGEHGELYRYCSDCANIARTPVTGVLGCRAGNDADVTGYSDRLERGEADEASERCPLYTPRPTAGDESPVRQAGRVPASMVKEVPGEARPSEAFDASGATTSDVGDLEDLYAFLGESGIDPRGRVQDVLPLISRAIAGWREGLLAAAVTSDPALVTRVWEGYRQQ